MTILYNPSSQFDSLLILNSQLGSLLNSSLLMRIWTVVSHNLLLSHSPQHLSHGLRITDSLSLRTALHLTELILQVSHCSVQQ